MNNINEKLDKLREYGLSTNNDFEETINEWTEQVERLEIMKEYREFDISKSISKALVSICLNATRRLIRENDQTERAKLNQDLDRCQWLLRFYNNNPEQAIKSIEQEINNELIKFEL